MKNFSIKSIAAAALLTISGSAAAHIWNIGWEATAGGGLDFYGMSYHTGAIGGVGSVDDFTANPAGLVINGSSINFDLGSATNLGDCNGAGGLVSGSCDATWNALGLDGVVQSTAGFVNPNYFYGKYAVVSLDSAELAGLGIGSGNNAITLTSFSPNVHWDGLAFASATVPINIVVLPPTGVPEPALLGMLGLGLVGIGLGRRRAR